MSPKRGKSTARGDKTVADVGGINVPKIYPICWFGIPQMAKWDIPKGGLGYWDMDNEAEL